MEESEKAVKGTNQSRISLVISVVAVVIGVVIILLALGMTLERYRQQSAKAQAQVPVEWSRGVEVDIKKNGEVLWRLSCRLVQP